MKYRDGDWVVCTKVSENNVEGLREGWNYQVVGWTPINQDLIYTLMDCWGDTHFAIDEYFRPVTHEDFWNSEYSPDAIEILDELAEENLEEFEQAIDKLFDDYEKVDHPSHYTKGNIECIDAIEEATKDLKGIRATDTGNVIKYMWRWKYKNGLEDLKKAQWYLNHLIEKEEKRLKKKEKKLRKHELRLKSEGK